MVRMVVLMPPGVSFFILLQHWGSFSSSISFFSKCRKKVFILIIKISLFCILQYISNIFTMKHSWVQQGQEVDNIFQRPKLPGMRLGSAAGTATLYHLLHLVHKRGPISAFERVFPSLAPQRSAALPACTAPSAFQPRHLLGRLASGVALLLLVIISYPFPSTRDFSITAVPGVSTAAFTVGLPQSWEPAFPMLALDRLAWVKQILLFITEDAPMAL